MTGSRVARTNCSPTTSRPASRPGPGSGRIAQRAWRSRRKGRCTSLTTPAAGFTRLLTRNDYHRVRGAMPDNPLKQLHDAGQSIWLDFIDRTILRNGDLQRRVKDEALTGMTSNPTIFEKALAEGTTYDDQIRLAEGRHTALDLFEVIATSDVRDACDIFRPVYDRTNGEDGYVSIEVSPGAANDAKATA